MGLTPEVRVSPSGEHNSREQILKPILPQSLCPTRQHPEIKTQPPLHRPALRREAGTCSWDTRRTPRGCGPAGRPAPLLDQEGW